MITNTRFLKMMIVQNHWDFFFFWWGQIQWGVAAALYALITADRMEIGFWRTWQRRWIFSFRCQMNSQRLQLFTITKKQRGEMHHSDVTLQQDRANWWDLLPTQPYLNKGWTRVLTHCLLTNLSMLACQHLLNTIQSSNSILVEWLNRVTVILYFLITGRFF